MREELGAAPSSQRPRSGSCSSACQAAYLSCEKFLVVFCLRLLYRTRLLDGAARYVRAVKLCCLAKDGGSSSNRMVRGERCPEA